MQHESGSDSVVKEVRREKKTVILSLAGEIDLNRSVQLRGAVLEVMREKPSVVVVNLSEVGFMDSSGLATLVEALQLSRRQGGKLKLVGATKRVRSILEISRLDSIFEMHDSEAEALA